MITFTLRMDDDVAMALNAEVEGSTPRISRTALIEHILYERYRETVERLRAERQGQQENLAQHEAEVTVNF